MQVAEVVLSTIGRYDISSSDLPKETYSREHFKDCNSAATIQVADELSTTKYTTLHSDGTSRDGNKVDWPVPKNLTEVRSFTGTCLYYRKFVKDFAHIAKPLFFLTEKNRPFVWDEETQKAFQTLKDKLTSSPILPFPNEDDPFIIDCDASALGLDCVLNQIQNETEKVIAFYGRTLSQKGTIVPHVKNY